MEYPETVFHRITSSNKKNWLKIGAVTDVPRPCWTLEGDHFSVVYQTLALTVCRPSGSTRIPAQHLLVKTMSVAVGVETMCCRWLPRWFRRGFFGLLLVWIAVSQAWDPELLLRSAASLGPRAQQGAQALREIILRVSVQDDIQRIVGINQFFNSRILFRTDEDVWGTYDYWASPLESLGKGQGDCEDYAIAKYFSLIASGMSPAKLRMVYVRAMIGGPGGVQQAHMVLAYYAFPEAEPYILDNLIADIRPAPGRPDLTPVFSFNTEGLWQGTQGNEAGDPLARLSRWREVVAKARQEGF